MDNFVIILLFCALFLLIVRAMFQLQFIIVVMVLNFIKAIIIKIMK